MPATPAPYSKWTWGMGAWVDTHAPTPGTPTITHNSLSAHFNLALLQNKKAINLLFTRNAHRGSSSTPDGDGRPEDLPPCWWAQPCDLLSILCDQKPCINSRRMPGGTPHCKCHPSATEQAPGEADRPSISGPPKPPDFELLFNQLPQKLPTHIQLYEVLASEVQHYLPYPFLAGTEVPGSSSFSPSLLLDLRRTRDKWWEE